MKKNSCGNCRFFAPHTNGGVCRIDPPAVIDDMFFWPLLDGRAWCGKWEDPWGGHRIEGDYFDLLREGDRIRADPYTNRDAFTGVFVRYLAGGDVLVRPDDGSAEVQFTPHIVIREPGDD